MTARSDFARRPKLSLIQIELAEANAFVERHHRHHERVTCHRFSIGATHEGRLVGVAIISPPVSGKHQKGPGPWAEVSRLCTDGTPNVCSFLYSAAARAATALGYERIQTYILDSENGHSLKAAGWMFERMTKGHNGWGHQRTDGKSRQQSPLHLCGPKQLWFKGVSEEVRTAIEGLM